LNNFPRKATIAWITLGLFILIYDVIAMSLNDYHKSKGSGIVHETLSDACWRGINHPTVRWPIWLSTAAIVKHLAFPNFLKKYDPISLVGTIIKRVSRSRSDG